MQAWPLLWHRGWQARPPCPCGRPCPHLDRAVGDPGRSVSCPLGGRAILLWGLTPNKPHGRSRLCELPPFSPWLCLPLLSSECSRLSLPQLPEDTGLQFAPGPLGLPGQSGAPPVSLPSSQALIPAPSLHLGGCTWKSQWAQISAQQRADSGVWQTVSLAPGTPTFCHQALQCRHGALPGQPHLRP